MVLLVSIPQPSQDGDGFDITGRIDHDHLEASLQRTVLLDVLAVFIERRGTDALKFSAAQGGLQNVGRIDCAFRSTSSNQRVQLVDEQDRVACAADFIHHCFDAFFELTAVLCAGDHHGEVKNDDALVTQQFRNIALNDHLGKALDDGGLSHARFAQQHRIVLLTSAENLRDAFDLVFAANDGIQLALLGEFRQVAAKTVQGRSLALGAFASCWRGSSFTAFARLDAVAEQVQDFLADFFQLQTEIHQYLRGNAFLLAEQTQQQMLGTDVVVIEVASLFHRVLNDFLGTRCLRQFAHRDHVRSRLHDFLDFVANASQVDIEVFQHVCGNARAFFHQAQQHVLGADVLVIETLSFLIRELHNLAGSVGESLVHPGVLLLNSINRHQCRPIPYCRLYQLWVEARYFDMPAATGQHTSTLRGKESSMQSMAELRFHDR